MKQEEPIVYIIEGEPIPLARARHAAHRVYDSQKNKKLVLGITLRNQHKDRPLYTGPLLLTATFFMPIPKTRQKQKNSLEGKTHIFTPDLSNLVKFIEDISSGVLYHDDCLIAEIIAKKIYGEPRTEFTLTKLK